MQALLREQPKDVWLALAVSAGLHLIVMLTLDIAPGAWRHGLQPALHVKLRPAPSLEPAPERPVAATAAAAAAPAQASPEAPSRGREASEASDGASLPGSERYFTSREVDVRAEAVHTGPLIFPEDAYLWRLAGSVRARVYISAEGKVDSVHIVEVRPRGGIFEETALEALRQLRYAPAQIGGRPVKSQKMVEVTFDPHEDMRAR